MTQQRPAGPAPILVIDLQTGMFDGVCEPAIHGAEALVDRTRAVLAWARTEGWPVAFVRHDGPGGDPLSRGEPGWPVWPSLGQGPEEPTFDKTVGDAFSNRDLAAWVADRGSDEVVLLGAQTEHCVAATLKGAMEAGLKVTVVCDAHSTWDYGGETADQIIMRLNAEFAAAGARLITTEVLTAEAPSDS